MIYLEIGERILLFPTEKGDLILEFPQQHNTVTVCKGTFDLHNIKGARETDSEAWDFPAERRKYDTSINSDERH
jgi:hypothetical protein